MPSPRRGSRPAEAGPGVGRHCRRASLRSSPRCTAPRILRCMHSGHRFRRHNRIDRRRNRRSSARLCSPAVRRARRCRCTRRRHLPTCRIAPPRSRDRDMRWYSRGSRGHCLPHPSFRLVHRHRTLSPRHLRHRRHPVWSPHTRAWRKKAPHPSQPPPTTSRQHHRDLLLGGSSTARAEAGCNASWVWTVDFRAHHHCGLADDLLSRRFRKRGEVNCSVPSVPAWPGSALERRRPGAERRRSFRLNRRGVAPGKDHHRHDARAR